MTKAVRATENNKFEFLCQLILEECQMINTKTEDHSKERNNKVHSNHEPIIQQLSKADANAEEALEKDWSKEFDNKNIKEELNTMKNSLFDEQRQINTLKYDIADQIDQNM